MVPPVPPITHNPTNGVGTGGAASFASS